MDDLRPWNYRGKNHGYEAGYSTGANRLRATNGIAAARARTETEPVRCLFIVEHGAEWQHLAKNARCQFGNVHVVHQWPSEDGDAFFRRAAERLSRHRFQSVVVVTACANAGAALAQLVRAIPDGEGAPRLEAEHVRALSGRHAGQAVRDAARRRTSHAA